jgi:general secretion pathway protein D
MSRDRKCGSRARTLAPAVRLLLTTALLGVAGCTTFPKLQVAPVAPLARPAEVAKEDVQAPRTKIKSLSPGATQALGAPSAPVVEATPEAIAALVPDRPIAVTLPPQPLTQFIDTVFGQVLKVPYFTGPGVARRRDIVTLSGPVQMPSRQFFAMVQVALRQYGLAVAIEGGAVKIVESDLLAHQAPLFMRARTLPETPPASRAVLRFASLSSVGVEAAADILRLVYRDGTAARFVAQQTDNSMVISGNPAEVSSASDLLQVIDQPSFAGGQAARIEPVFWPAQALAEAVRDVMMKEGFLVTVGPGSAGGGATLLPIPYANTILAFSDDRTVFQRALYWAQELDSPAAFQDQEGVFIYQVQNTTAAELGALVAQLTPEGAAPEPGQRIEPLVGDRKSIPRAENGLRPTEAPAAPTTNGKITIDPGGNRLIFHGKRSEFATLRAVMVQLDTPPKEVLVEITIAEVTLTDETRFGLEWFLNAAVAGGDLSVDTRGGLVKEPGGLGATFTRAFSTGTVTSALNAIAQSTNLNILSTPRLVARSGSQAQILIGSDVPIITSQRAANSQNNGDTDILQTVQYRQTGVILNMRPVVYGADRVDIELFQEVSSQQPNRTSTIDSPIILNRSVTTQLSLREGMTAVIGGLIQDSYTREQKGVPLLKDIPLLGQLFRVDSVSGGKTELLILVTPYVIRSDENMGEASSVYAGSINRLLKDRGPQVYTLLPWRSIFGQKPRTHGGRLLTPEGAEEPPPPTKDKQRP